MPDLVRDARFQNLLTRFEGEDIFALLAQKCDLNGLSIAR
jgi:hypothetical protein